MGLAERRPGPHAQGTHFGHHFGGTSARTASASSLEAWTRRQRCGRGSGAKIVTLKGHTGVVRSASFNPDWARIVTASEDETAKVWDAHSGAEILTLKGHTSIEIPAGVLSPDVFIGGLPFEGVNSAGFSPDGTQIVTGSGDQTAKVWDAERRLGPHAQGAHLMDLFGELQPRRRAHRHRKLRPDGEVVGRRSGAEIRTLKGHTSWIWLASFSPDGVRIVTTSGDKTAKLWDARSVRRC